MHFQELGHVELWLLEYLTLSDVDLVEWVGRGSSLGDVGGDRVRQKFADNGADVRAGNLSSHDVHHLLTDDSDLGRLSVGGLLDLVDSSFGESDTEETEFVPVGGGDVYVSFDLRLPLLDHGALLISSKLHTVEVSQTMVTLDLLAHETKCNFRKYVKIGMQPYPFRELSIRLTVNHFEIYGNLTRHREDRPG